MRHNLLKELIAEDNHVFEIRGGTLSSAAAVSLDVRRYRADFECAPLRGTRISNGKMQRFLELEMHPWTRLFFRFNRHHFQAGIPSERTIGNCNVAGPDSTIEALSGIVQRQTHMDANAGGSFSENLRGWR